MQIEWLWHHIFDHQLINLDETHLCMHATAFNNPSQILELVLIAYESHTAICCVLFCLCRDTEGD